MNSEQHLSRTDNTVAIVTGGSGQIGRAAVSALARKGMKVAFTFQGGVDSARELIAELEGTGVKVEAHRLEIRSSEEDFGKLLHEADRSLGRPTVLVNCTGIKRDGSFLSMADEEWDDVLAVNLTSAFKLCRAFCAFQMSKTSEPTRIINVGSISGTVGMAGQVNYSASKAGLIGMTKAIAKEMARSGVSINLVSPGAVESQMMDSLSPRHRNQILSLIPMGRMCRADEVAKIILFLSDFEACPHFLTGSIIDLSGGM